MKSGKISDLVKVLEEKIKAYKGLQTVSLEQNRLLIGNDLKTIQESAQTQQQLILEIQAMEKASASALQSLGSELKIAPDKMSVEELSRRLSAEDKKTLQKLNRQILGLRQDLIKINTANGVLLGNALKYLSMFKVTPDEGKENVKTYTPKGGLDAKKERPKPTSLDFKA